MPVIVTPITPSGGTALTVADYYLKMLHAIGNPSNGAPSTGITLLDCLKEALRELFDYHDWEWRKRPAALVNFVNGQEYAALPADFGYGDLLSVHPVVSSTLSVKKTNLSQIAAFRGSAAQGAYDYYVAVAWPTQSSGTSAPGAARLEIWPTPSSNVTGALRVTYRAGPIELDGTTSTVPNIPAAFEGALAMLCRGIIKRYEFDGDVGEYSAALQRLEQLKESDGMQDFDVGRITGGAIMQHPQSPLRSFDPATIPDH